MCQFTKETFISLDSFLLIFFKFVIIITTIIFFSYYYYLILQNLNSPSRRVNQIWINQNQGFITATFLNLQFILLKEKHELF